MRYRAERHEFDDLRPARARGPASIVGAPLTLAAGATAAGFLSFLPTDYRGVSELGLIAGFGMLIAFVTSVTLLPALIRLLNPPGEPEPLGFSFLAPVDDFLERQRIPIIVGTALVVIAGLPLLYWLQFDFNPINLRDPKSESIATYLDLSRDPDTNTNAVEVLAPSLAEAERHRRPAVEGAGSRARHDADELRARAIKQEKLPLIRSDAAKTFAGAFDPKNAVPPPTRCGECRGAQGRRRPADRGRRQADRSRAPSPPSAWPPRSPQSRRAAQELRAKAEAAFIPPLKIALGGLQASLQAQPVTQQSLPPELVRDWMTPDGRARVAGRAQGRSRTTTTQMRQFARAVLAVEPNAIEGPISILEAGDTIVRAFIEAGLWALLSIGILLWIVLRRIGDVLLTLIPLMIAGVVTLELCVLIGLPLNFANIIALPLLLGVGVAFKIYYIMAWREGQTNLLQTSLTRAVFFSALTTATAFGSLWFSSHPGTASMGKLLALSLICTLAAAVLFQPVLMGKPRNDECRRRANFMAQRYAQLQSIVALKRYGRRTCTRLASMNQGGR